MKTLISLCLLLALTVAASAEKYVVSLSATATFLNPETDRLKKATNDTNQFIKNLLSRLLLLNPTLDQEPKNYRLVFSQGANPNPDSLELVVRTSGAVVATIVTFTTAQDVISTDLETPVKTSRIAAMSLFTAPFPSGLAHAVIKADPFKYSATFLLALPASGTDAAANISGTFVTGIVFAPTGP